MELLLSAAPNQLGEILRAATFPEQELEDEERWALGCRDTFVVREDAEPWDELKLRAFYERFLPEEADWLTRERPGYPGQRTAKGYSFEVDGLQIECSWFWDGDGILLYGVFKDGELKRALENTDCKKDYVWKDAGDPDGWGGLEPAFRAAQELDGRELFLAVVESDDESRAARLERRFLEREQAESWAQEQLDAGCDRAEIRRRHGQESELLASLVNPASVSQAQAGPLSRPSSLSHLEL